MSNCENDGEGYVKSTIDFADILSPESLAALQELAVSRGVIGGDSSDDEDGNNGVKSGSAYGSNASSSGVNDLVFKLKSHFDQVRYGDKEEMAQIKYGPVEFEVKAVKQDLGQTLSSTGLTIWRAAENLCEWIVENQDRFKGRSICELGGGLGIVSILLHKLNIAKQIICTDGDDLTVKLLKENVENTGCEETGMLAEKLYWGEHESFMEEHKDIDCIVAADVIYMEDQIVPLMTTTADMMKKSKENNNSVEPEMILAYCRRSVPIQKVYDCATGLGLKYIVKEQDAEPLVFFTLAD